MFQPSPWRWAMGAVSGAETSFGWLECLLGLVNFGFGQAAAAGNHRRSVRNTESLQTCRVVTEWPVQNNLE